MAVGRPRITTVVPTFRRPALLARALDSVALQTYSRYQVRVYDNASGDETPSVVHEYSTRDARFEYHVQPVNIGSERNFEFGLEQVDTEFFSFLSDDDVLLPHLYELAVTALDQYPGAAMAAAGVIHANGAGTFAREPSLAPGLHHPPDGLAEMLRLNQPAWTGTLFRTELVRRAGGIDAETVIDLDLELRLAAHDAVVVLAEPGAVLMTENHFGKCLAWPDRFERTISKLEHDENLPVEIRQLARPSLDGRLRSMVYQTGIVAARMGKVEVARRAARVLATEFRDRRGSFIVSAMAGTGRLAPMVGPAYKRVRSAIRRSSAPTPSETLREELRAMAPSLIDRLSNRSAA